MALRILTIVGARPQFIKAAVLSRVIAAEPGATEIMVHTGQHFDTNMSDIFFQELAIPAPARHLGVHGGGHGEMTGRMLAALEPVMIAAKPDVVVVYGDTNSTLAGALAAVKLRLPVAHVEAGLRSFNRAMPEEINRVLADHASDLLFCPTEAAVANLCREGISDGVCAVGDVMYDAALFARDAAPGRSDIIERLGLEPGRYALATLHRAENTDDPTALKRAIDYLTRAARERRIVFPIHPRTRAATASAGVSLAALDVVEPLGYFDIHRLLQDAALVFTDSGGLQKEAYFHRVPCVTLRAGTEWVETIACGWNRLWEVESYCPRRDIAEYGDGRAGERILRAILERYAPVA
ncbi:MAG TPA: UDP-N-acetylglucosamine 2-epimerase (non-hydrolyzing) [Stellaceae bacterium]|nr:UDP-N-acetylglucosamine 2-epimerase (non-hydrolyzing) [Stellaceae bacterium]